MKRKPLGKPLPESEEEATPDERDMVRADEIASADEIVDALWNAEEKEDEV